MDPKLPDKTIAFHCSDGKIASVDIRCCYESDLIATLYTLHLFNFAVNFPSDILSLVNEFYTARVNIFEAYPDDDHLYLKELRKFDASFRQKLSDVEQQLIIEAARLLRIESLCKLLGVTYETPRKKGKLVLTAGEWKSIMESIFFLPESLPASFRYICPDGKVVYVDPRCSYESLHVHRALKETVDKEQDSIKKGYRKVTPGEIGRHAVNVAIPSKILSIVTYFCMARFGVKTNAKLDEDVTSDMLHFFGYCFVQSQSLPLLVELMQAAYKLGIRSLLDLTHDAIVPKLDRKSAEEILKTFHLLNINH
uniref:uncharacterized protein LOC122593712 n=1 Tax=Erigeron canadensis TaxID=72917 RepID=UPI001CB8E110|nr:uncharacterized protein LOC122593712 [Erigeron canadensis]